jgi:hypothetical protein
MSSDDDISDGICLTSTWSFVAEKRGRGRSLIAVHSWKERRFVISGQKLTYYEETTEKGSVNITDATADAISPASIDGKLFAFEIDTVGNETLFLNVSCETLRRQCIMIINKASRDPYWKVTSRRERELGQQLSSMGNTLTKMTTTKLDVEKQLIESKATISALENSLKVFQNRMETAKSQIITQNATISDLETQLAMSQSTVTVLESELKSLR